MKKIEIEIVSTIKIQSIENGKRVTRRRFNTTLMKHLNINLSKEIQFVLNAYVDDVRKEVLAEQRTAEEWACLIKKHTRSKQLRGWAANIIWWNYSDFPPAIDLSAGAINKFVPREENVLYKLSKTFNPEECPYKVKQVMLLLERMGCPKKINNYAKIREKKRTNAIKNCFRFGRSVALESLEKKNE